MSMKDLLAELQRDYLTSFPDKIARLRAHWNEQNYHELRTEYHKLKGTGKTYGIPEVSQLGEALETLCEALIEGDRSALETAVPLSLTLLERIRGARNDGRSFNLDDDRDFRVIVELVLSHGARS